MFKVSVPSFRGRILIQLGVHQLQTSLRRPLVRPIYSYKIIVFIKGNTILWRHPYGYHRRLDKPKPAGKIPEPTDHSLNKMSKVGFREKLLILGFRKQS